MSAPNSLQRLSLRQFADRFRSEMIPLGSRFCYFCAAVSLSEEDLKDYLQEPVAALPPSIAQRLPEIRILLVPYLAQPESGAKRRTPAETLVAIEKPKGEGTSLAATLVGGTDAVLAFAIEETEVADYHYQFYRAIAGIIASAPNGMPKAYAELVRTELAAGANGEVDEASWTAKTELSDKDLDPAKPTKKFKEYLRQSFIDTLTLFLHGICCDIDVDSGPRQLPSRLMRKRLELLRDAFPPPEGYAVLPEDVKTLKK